MYQHDISMFEVSSFELQDWSDKPEAKSSFPKLVKMLISATVKNLSLCHFHYKEDNQRHGVDGRVKTDVGNEYVPAGESYWEVGTNEKIENKANQDYQERTYNNPVEGIKDKVFVFVTSRRWTNCYSWAEEKRKEQQWKDVRVIDAESIRTWLTTAPSVNLWMAKTLGKIIEGVSHLDMHWEQWAEACYPPLTSNLFKESVERVITQVSDWLHSENAPYMSLQCDSLEEGLAFLKVLFDYSSVEDYKGRLVVVETVAAARILNGWNKRIIPILISNEAAEYMNSSSADYKCIILQKSGQANSCSLVVDVAPLDFRALEFEVSRYVKGGACEQLYRKVGRSRSILRSVLSHNPAVKEPRWLRNKLLDADELIPFLLCGTIYVGAESAKGGKDVLQLLLNGGSLNRFLRKLKKVASEFDSPIWAFENYIGITGKEELLYLMRDEILPEHLELFVTAFAKLQKGEIRSDYKGIDRLTHLYEIILLLIVHEHDWFGNALVHIRKYVENISDVVFREGDINVLKGNKHYLAFVAEAWPERYYELLLDLFQLPDEEFKNVLNLVTPSVESYFIKSLQILAINENYYSHILLFLERMYNICKDTCLKEEFLTRLQELLFCWGDMTNAPLQETKKYVETLIVRNEKLGWLICKEQLLNELGCIWNPPKTRYRGGKWKKCREITEQDIHDYRLGCLKLLMNSKSYSYSNIRDLILICGRVDKSLRNNIWPLVENLSVSLADSEKVKLQELCKKEIRRRKTREKFYEYIQELENIIKCFDVEDAVLNVAHLFSWHAELEDIKKISGYENVQSIEESQDIAIKKLIQNNRMDFAGIISNKGGDVYSLGRAVARNLPLNRGVDYLRYCISDMKGNTERAEDLLWYYCVYVLQIDGTSYSSLCEEFCNSVSNEDKIYFLKATPWSNVHAAIFNQLELSIRLAYWIAPKITRFSEFSKDCESYVNFLLENEKYDMVIGALYDVMKIENPAEKVIDLVKKSLRGLSSNLEAWDFNNHFDTHNLKTAFEFLDKAGEPLAFLAFREVSFMCKPRFEIEDKSYVLRYFAEKPKMFARFVSLYKKGFDAAGRLGGIIQKLDSFLVVSSDSVFAMSEMVPTYIDWINSVLNELADKKNRQHASCIIMSHLGRLCGSCRDESQFVEVCKCLECLEEYAELGGSFVTGVNHAVGATVSAFDSGGAAYHKIAGHYRRLAEKASAYSLVASNLIMGAVIFYEQVATMHDISNKLGRYMS